MSFSKFGESAQAVVLVASRRPAVKYASAKKPLRNMNIDSVFSPGRNPSIAAAEEGGSDRSTKRQATTPRGHEAYLNESQFRFNQRWQETDLFSPALYAAIAAYPFPYRHLTAEQTG